MDEELETGETTDVAHITLMTLPSIKSSLPLKEGVGDRLKNLH
jgi:hypothetical protein